MSPAVAAGASTWWLALLRISPQSVCTLFAFPPNSSTKLSKTKRLSTEVLVPKLLKTKLLSTKVLDQTVQDKSSVHQTARAPPAVPCRSAR